MQHIKTRINAGLLALTFSVAPFVSTANGQSLLAEERLRRQADTQAAVDLLMEGRKSYASKNYEEAVRLYREALNKLPYGPNTEAQRAEIAAHLADGSVALSQQYRRLGKYEEAQSLLGDVLVADPNNFAAQKSLEYFDDPIRTNPSLTFEHSQNVDEVRRLLYQGEGFYNLGDYDAALEKFNAVLRIDKYNKAARRWQERVTNEKVDYYRAAYDQARADMLMQVDAAWEQVVPSVEDAIIFGDQQGTQGQPNQQNILNKLRSIQIPIVDFQDTPLDEAVEYLTQKSIELDPEGVGINFVVETGSVGSADDGGGVDQELGGGSLLLGGDPGGKMIDSLRLRNVPMATVLDYVTGATGMRYRIDEYAVTLLPLGSSGGEGLISRSWTVPPTFSTDISEGGGGDEGGGDLDPFAEPGGGLGGSGIQKRRSVQESLQALGIEFPQGASARYVPASSKLVVRNTVANLDLVDSIVGDIINKTPKQIHITTKFVEVTQDNTDELGFDWIISPFQASDTYFLGGGVQGNGAIRTGNDFVPFTGFTESSTEAIASGSVTSGLRSGDYSINRNNIDSVLNNPDRTAQSNTVAPGILSLTGLFSSGQVQMIMRGLAQKKGTDIMTAPSVIARSGETATIEIIREFIYPTEYEPPELPNNVGSSFGSGLGLDSLGSSSTFPVTPSTPTAFETRNTGVTLEVQPTLGANDYVIDLRFAPEIVEFEGFINYGSPITSPGTDALGNPTQVTITDNRIEMPVFATRRVNTGITIYDGHTVAVGGLMREDVQRVEDKVPLLGDLPFIGRLFQSKSENHIKSNLIVFVTARIIDATGRPIQGGLGSDDSSNAFSASGDLSAGVLPPLD